MFQYCANMAMCQCSLRRRNKLASGVVSLTFLFLFSPVFRNKQVIALFTRKQSVGQFLYRAKNTFHLGLLALFFSRLNCHYVDRRLIYIYA